jgi:hypothetical protein
MSEVFLSLNEKTVSSRSNIAGFLYINSMTGRKKKYRKEKSLEDIYLRGNKSVRSSIA